MPVTPADVRTLAKHTFARLRPQFQAHTIFWQLGHALDTIVDYLGLFAPEDGQGFGETVMIKFLRRGGVPVCDGDDPSVPRNPWWFDDYGWWGIAGLNASRYPNVFGRLTEGFRGIADLMWEPMYRWAPRVWENASNDENWKTIAPPHFKISDYAPLFEGGVWNWIYTPGKIACIPFTPAIPNDLNVSNLRSIQNTVTNGLYWVLTARLYRDTGNPIYREAASTEYSFLRQWFTLKEACHALLDPQSGPALVRERVATYKSGTTVRDYDPALFWSGDQGLILGGLIDHLNIAEQHDRSPLVDTAKRIVDGVKGRMTGAGVLRPWIPWIDEQADHGAPGGDVDDYTTGAGVYMRYLSHAYRTSGDLRDHLIETGYREWLTSNVEAIFDKRGDTMLTLTNDLATLLCWLVVHQAL